MYEYGKIMTCDNIDVTRVSCHGDTNKCQQFSIFEQQICYGRFTHSHDALQMPFVAHS